MLNIGGIQARSFYRRIGTLPIHANTLFDKIYVFVIIMVISMRGHPKGSVPR